MAHELETMFYVSNEENQRFKPWHGLGTAVEEAPNSKEALKLAGLDWTVDSRPIFTDNGIEIPGYRANTRSSDNKVLGIVGNKYKIVQNAEAFEFTDALIGDNVRYETAGSLYGGKRIWLLAKMPTTTILGDDVEPYLTFTNTHDGTGAIKVCMTPVRVVCNNTLNIALNGASRKWSARHMGNIESKLKEAQHTLELAETYMENLATMADQYANTKVTDDEVRKVLNTVFEAKETDSDRKKANMEKAKDEFIACYFAPDIMKFMGTQWGLINAAADYVGHTAPNRMTENYQENNWGRIIEGHHILDSVVSLLSH